MPTDADSLKILFTDIDGVLNSVLWVERRGRMEDKFKGNKEWNDSYHALDPQAMARLNKILKKTNAVCVITSTWRTILPLPVMYGLMCARGFEGELIGCTPSLASTRGREIQTWLNMLLPLKPAGFAILDDDRDMGILQRKLVKVQNRLGLQDTDVMKAVTMLNKREQEA